MSELALPEEWIEVTVDDVFDQISTTSKKIKTKDSKVKGNYPVVDQGKELINGYHDNKNNLISVDKPVIIFGDHTRCLKWIPFSFVPGADGVKVLKPNSYISEKFSLYQLQSIQIKDRGYGRHFKLLKESKFYVIPELEQKELVKLLDIHLTTVSQIQARLDAIPKIIEKFRQSVLSDAVSGELTKEWRVEKTELKRNRTTDWLEIGFSDVGSLSRGKSKHRPRNDPKLFGDKYPFIQTGEVANSDGTIKKATKFYSDFGLAQSKLFPKETLCITIAANIADTAILKIDACFPDSVVGFIANKNICDVKFIKYLIDTNKENLEHFAPATAQKNINLKVLNSLVFPLPSIEEQTEIVQRVEQFFAYSDQIGKSVAIAKARVDYLTQSILNQAFTGNLTAEWREQNPELISGENSAEALLAKINAEKKKASKA